MKKVMLAMMVACVVLLASTVTADAYTSDKALAKRWAKAHYPKYKTVFVSANSRVLNKRTGKKVVFISKVWSRAKGGYAGRTKGGYYIRYNKRVRKGRRCVSYFVYSPYSNEYDDVVAVIDHGRVR